VGEITAILDVIHIEVLAPRELVLVPPAELASPIARLQGVISEASPNIRVQELF